MSIDLPTQSPNGIAGSSFINSMAAAVEAHDAWIEAVTASWSTYTPSWTTSGTQPAINNGQISGRYKQIGSTVHCWIALKMGSTTTYGTGQWSLGLPITPRDPGAPFDDYASPGDFTALDVSAVTRYHGRILRNNGSNVIMLSSASGAAVATLNNTTPFTWANGDYLSLLLTYEAQ